MARILLLFGGRSAEHEVSCVSAVAVSRALVGAGHDVTPVGIDKTGGWHLADPEGSPLVARGPEARFEVPGGHLTSDEHHLEFDVVFPVLHGPFGEDGTIQGLFEIGGIPYVGCGVLSSSIAMDKDVAKRLAAQEGIPTPRWRVLSRTDSSEPSGDLVRSLVGDLGLPLFVKPAALGSSVGVGKAESEAELKEAIENAARFGPKVVVEEAIDGREIEVAVLGGPRASLPGEIVLPEGWYDYDAKYVSDTSEFVTPAALDATQTAAVRDLAERVFELFGCDGLARVDFLFEEAGRGFLLNEINTMPGFTPISGFPKMWEASGMTYPELCDELVRMALES